MTSGGRTGRRAEAAGLLAGVAGAAVIPAIDAVVRAPAGQRRRPA
jgi:hypothetical protein